MSEPIVREPPKAPGKRYRLTVMHSDLCASTQLGKSMESEHQAELMSRIRVIWHEVASRHGGVVLRTQGDGALIVFGYPGSSEDDGRRAAEFALDVHERVALLDFDGLPRGALPLQMHSGIHAGTLLLADGDLESGRFDLTGDVVNTAGKLEKAAGPGQILSTLETLGPHANFFELGADPRDPTSPSSGVGCVQVLRRAGVTRRFDATARRGLTPFIGRSEATRFLLDFIRLEPGRGRPCAVIVGAAGLGKTRLLEELSSQPETRGFTLLRGSCESYLGAEVLQPFVQMLRSYFGLDAAMPASSDASQPIPAFHPVLEELGLPADSLAGLLSAGTQPTGHASASGVVGELLAFFKALSAKVPVLMMLDDWQWADDASRQLLEALLQLPTAPRVIVAARPRDDGGEWIAAAPHLELSPLLEQETGIAVRRWLPDADPFLAAQIHAYAGGVPLFIEELCHSASADSLWQGLQGRGTMQTWLATLVASRLARLPAEQADIVRAAAAIGNVVPTWLLEIGCERALPAAALQALADADFLYPDERSGMLRFKHGITRDAVYGGIGLYERTALHQRIETALLARSKQPDREDTLEALAHHSRGAKHWDRCAHYAERAGDKATAAFALDRARAQYQAGMDALDNLLPARTREQSLRWCTIANKLGMTCIFDPLALSDDLGVFERAVALAAELDDGAVLARCQYWLGYMSYGFGRFREGVAHARKALALARQLGEARLAAQIEAALGQMLAATCDYGEAIALMDSAVSIKRQKSRGSGAIAMGSAYTLACKGSVLADRGDFVVAHACFDEAMELLDGSTHPVANSVRNWVAVALVWQGRWQEAERIAAESVRIAENTRSLLLLVVCQAAAGFSRWAETGSPGGFDQLRDAVRWMESRRGQFYTSLYYGWLVEACVGTGRIDEARRYAVQVLKRARQGERLGEAMACRAMATLSMGRGASAVAQRWLRRAEASAAIRGSAREAALNQAARAQLLAWQGEEAAARQLAEPAAATLESLGMQWHAAQVWAMPSQGSSISGYSVP